MDLLSWFTGSKPKNPPKCKSCGSPGESGINGATEVRRPDSKSGVSSGESGMNGATEIPRPDSLLDLTVLAFGEGDKEMLVGYCPVSEKIEPCSWKVMPIIPEHGPEAPMIRILF